MVLMAVAEDPERSPHLRLVEGPRDDAALVAGLEAGEPWARELFFDRYAPLVERTLRRVLGPEFHDEMSDRIHDAFVQALESIGSLREPRALPGFVRAVAANTAKKSIRNRKARRWLRFWEPAQLPVEAFEDVDAEVREAYRRTYAILAGFSADDRLAFTLRHVEGLELTEVAEACAVSLATIKRRLKSVSDRFSATAKRDLVLRAWLEEGGRFS